MAIKVIVTGNLGKFEEGQELTSQANIVKYFTTMLNEGRSEENATRLTAKQIMAAVTDGAIEDVVDENNEEDILKALEDLETTPDKPEEKVEVISEAQAKLEQASAAEFAHRLDKETIGALSEAWTIKKRSGVMPLVHMINLTRCWGKDGMRSAPVGGSIRLDVGGKYVLAIKRGKDDIRVLPDNVQNLRPDKYTAKGSDNKDHPMSFYADVFDATETGIALRNQIAIYEGALQSPPAATTPDNLKSKDSFTLAEEKDTLNKSRTFQIGQLRKAIECFRQIEAVNGLPNAGCYLYLVKRGDLVTVKETTAPVVIHDWMDNPDGNKDANGNVIRFPVRQLPVSIGKFLKFDVAKAAKLGGNCEALEKTTERDTEAAKQEKKAKAEGLDLVIKNVKQFEAAVGEMAHMHDDPKFLGDLLAALHKPDTDAFLVSIFDTGKGVFDYIMSKPDFQRRVLAFRERETTKTGTSVAA